MLQFVIGIPVTPKISESHQMELRKTRPRDGWSGRPKDAKFNRWQKKVVFLFHPRVEQQSK